MLTCGVDRPGIHMSYFETKSSCHISYVAFNDLFAKPICNARSESRNEVEREGVGSVNVPS